MTYAVCVTFDIHEDQVDAFMPFMIKNAQTSLKDEDGCLQFDVLTDPSRPSEVFLYELYVSANAFQVHLASDHFQAFDAAVSSMIANKTVKIFTQVAQ